MKIKITSDDYVSITFSCLLCYILLEKGITADQSKFWYIIIPVFIIYYLIFKIFKHYD